MLYRGLLVGAFLSVTFELRMLYFSSINDSVVSRFYEGIDTTTGAMLGTFLECTSGIIISIWLYIIIFGYFVDTTLQPKKISDNYWKKLSKQ